MRLKGISLPAKVKGLSRIFIFFLSVNEHCFSPNVQIEMNAWKLMAASICARTLMVPSYVFVQHLALYSVLMDDRVMVRDYEV